MIKITSLSLALSSLVLSGCAMVGPDYQTPDNIVGVTLTDPVDLTNEYTPAQNALSWWQHFDDAELDRLVALGLEQNRSLARAEANVNRAYAVFSNAQSDRNPTGELGGSYNAVRNPSSADSDNSSIVRSYQSGLTLNWDLDLVGKLHRATESARAQADQAVALFQDAQVQIVSQIATSYGDFRAAEQRLVVAEENLNSLRQTQGIIKARYQAGVVSDLEMARMDAQVLDLQSQIPSYRLAMARSQATLSALLGVGPGELTIAANQTMPDLQAPLEIRNDSGYLRHIPSVAAAERALAARTADIGVATADLYPQVSFSGFLGFLGNDSRFIEAGNRSWSVLPAISWQGLNRQTVRSRINAAEATQQMALADFEQAVIEALATMDLAVKAYNYSRDELLIYQQQLERMQAAVEISRARYQVGSGEFLDLLDAERALLAVRDRIVQLKQQNFNQLVAVYQSFAGALEV